MKIQFASKVVFFWETLKYVNAINICYIRQFFHLQAKVPFGLTWAIFHVVMRTLTLMVK
jgi:hypothetical protein